MSTGIILFGNPTVNAPEADDIDEVEALFGSEKFFWQPNNGGVGALLRYID